MHFRYLLILSILLAAGPLAVAQVGQGDVLGTAFLAVPCLANAEAPGKSALPVCTPQTNACHTKASLTYIFTGSGNWNVPGNWLNELIPPQVLPQEYQIIIDPTGSLQCILNISQTIQDGAMLTVMPGKTLLVAGGVLIR